MQKETFMSITKIYTGGHFVGTVSGGIFHKSIKASRHLLRQPPAICLSVESLQQAERAGACEIEVTDTETGRVYHSTTEHFRRYAWQIQRGNFEKQYAMSLERWSVTVTDAPKYQSNATSTAYHAPTVTELHKPEAVQISMFEAVTK